MSIRQIYCYCTGETTVALFNTQHECASIEHAAKVSGCCDKTAQPTLTLKSCCADLPAVSEERNCTHTTVKVFQLKTAFIADGATYKTVDHPLSIAVPQPIAWAVPVFFETLSAAILLNKAPPPPISGRTLCLRYQVIRC